MALYTFDPLGNLAQNRIQNELHNVTELNGVDHNYIVPDAAPFYDESLVVVDAATGQSLVSGVDYFFIYPFGEATEKVGKPISGGIAFVDPNRNGNFAFNYQTLGGDYVNDETKAIADGLDALGNLVSRRWQDLVNVPVNFPPTPHTARLSSINGVSEILAHISQLEAAIRSPERHISIADIVDLNEGYVEPMTQGFHAIANAITALGMDHNYYCPEVNTGAVLSDLGSQVGGEWFEIGLEIAPLFDGTYLLNICGNPLVTVPSGKPQYEFRFKVDDTLISQSALTNTVIGLTANQKVTVEMRVLGEDSSRVIVADRHVSCGVTLLRVSN